MATDNDITSTQQTGEAGSSDQTGQSEWASSGGGPASSANVQPTTAPTQQQGQPQQTVDEGQQAAATPYSQAGGKYAQPAQASQPTQNQKHASIFHSIMETLAGPTTPKYRINPNTGEQEAVPQPRRSMGQLANSVVAGALSGLFAGAGTPKMEGGLVAMGKGYNAVQAKQQQAQEQAKKESSEAYIRQQATAEHNLRLHQLGVATANLDMDFNNKVNESGKQEYDDYEANDMIQKDHIRQEDIPAMLKSNSNITRDMFKRSPDKSYPLIGPDGKPTNEVGNFYYILKPGAKAHVTEDDIKAFNAAGIHDFDKISPDQELDVHAVSKARDRVNMLKAIGAISDNHNTSAGPGVPPTAAPAPVSKVTADTPVSSIDANILADTITKNEASSYKNNPGALKFRGQPGATLGPNGFAIFATPEAGHQALLNDNAAKLKANPGMTISQLINTRTPVGADGNTQAQVDTQVNNVIKAAQGATQTPAPKTKQEVKDEDLYSAKLAEAAKNGDISNEFLKVLTNFTLSREPLDAVKAMHANAVPEQYINKFVEMHGGMDAMNKRASDVKLAEAVAKTKAEKTATVEAESTPEYINAKAKIAGAEEAARTAAKLGVDIEGAENLHGDEFLAKLPANERSVVKNIADGKSGSGSMYYLLSRNPSLAAHVAQYDPDFDKSKIEGYNKVVLDYATPKPNTTGGALNSGATAFKHMRDLKKINDDNPVEVRIHGTEANKAYNNLQDTLAGELAQFYQLPKTNESISSMKGTLGGFFSRDSAIVRQARSMGEKFDSYEQSWREAAPSKHYVRAMPQVDDESKEARASLDPDYKKRYENEKKNPLTKISQDDLNQPQEKQGGDNTQYKLHYSGPKGEIFSNDGTTWVDAQGNSVGK